MSLLSRKYQIAVIDADPTFLIRMANALKDWYSNKITVKTYKDYDSLFLGINMAEVKQKPFDMAIMKTEELPTSMVLKHTKPAIKVLMCDSVQTLKSETDKFVGK